jgi:hypothetical protein
MKIHCNSFIKVDSQKENLYSNLTWEIAQVMKLLIMQFSRTSCYLIPLQSIYYSQKPIPKGLHPFLP